jgi:hypothetical protein
MDFSTNPYTTVLIPEPMDYFSACGATSVCEAKCNAEYTSFDRQLALEAAMHSMSPVTKTIEKTTESMLFVDLDEDAYTPMNIMAMVELSDCRSVFSSHMPFSPRMLKNNKLAGPSAAATPRPPPRPTQGRRTRTRASPSQGFLETTPSRSESTAYPRHRGGGSEEHPQRHGSCGSARYDHTAQLLMPHTHTHMRMQMPEDVLQESVSPHHQCA